MGGGKGSRRSVSRGQALVVAFVALAAFLMSLGVNTGENVAESCYVLPDRIESWGERVDMKPRWHWWLPGWGCDYRNTATGDRFEVRPGWLSTVAAAASAVLLLLSVTWAVRPLRSRQRAATTDT